MHTILYDFIPHTLPFWDNIPIKECEGRVKDEELDEQMSKKEITSEIMKRL